MEKRCSKCKEVKDLSEFNKMTSAYDGVQKYCKQCQKQAYANWRIQNTEKNELKNRKWLVNNRERNAEQSKTWYENNKDKARSAIHAWRAANTEKAVCHKILNSAVSCKALSRPSKCWSCGEDDRKIDGHHSDYTQPLKVIWICKICHYDLHNLERELRKSS